MDTYLLGLSVPMSLIVCILSDCKSLYLSHKLQEEASMMGTEMQQNVIRNNLLISLYNRNKICFLF